MGAWHKKAVEVELWVVLDAIRYGMGRLTYANQDASILARRFWDDFPPEICDQITSDAARILDRACREEWAWLAEVN